MTYRFVRARPRGFEGGVPGAITPTPSPIPSIASLNETNNPMEPLNYLFSPALGSLFARVSLLLRPDRPLNETTSWSNC